MSYSIHEHPQATICAPYSPVPLTVGGRLTLESALYMKYLLFSSIFKHIPVHFHLLLHHLILHYKRAVYYPQ